MEKSEEKKPDNTATKKEPAKADNQAGKEEKKTAWEIGLETIAGDNKLLSTALKVVLSPIGLVVVFCGVGFLIYKILNYKKENEKLEAENKKLLEEYKDLKDDHDKWKEKHLLSRSRKIIGEDEHDTSGLDHSVSRPLPFGKDTHKKKQQTFYLD